jgi:hypothetical protein
LLTQMQAGPWTQGRAENQPPEPYKMKPQPPFSISTVLAATLVAKSEQSWCCATYC